MRDDTYWEGNERVNREWESMSITDSAQSEIPSVAEPAAPRDITLDVYRGVLILSTVAIHVFSELNGRYVRGSTAWTFCAVVNTLLLYAVPGFLLLSSLLSISKLLKPYSLRDYLQRRVHGILIPYLIWSAFYIALMFRHPAERPSIKSLLVLIAIGKSVGHLYYLGLMIQLTIVLIVVALLFRKRVSLPALLLAIMALTLTFYALNRFYLHLPYVGSIIFWYIPAIAVGCWLGTDKHLLHDRLQRAIWLAAPLALVGIAGYLPLSMQVMAQQNVNSFYFQAAEWLYTTASAVVLLCISLPLSRTNAARAIAWLGGYSMQIYVAHPFFLSIAVRLFHPKSGAMIVLSGIIYAVVAIGGALALARLFERVKLSNLVYGR